MMEGPELERERALLDLAGRLYFKVEKRGARFSLFRDVDVRRPVRHDDLTLIQAEELLETWKLRGFHGG
jgi:hypothetical protein